VSRSLYSPWPGLTRPPSATASAGAGESFRRADARLLGGPVKPGHGDVWRKRLGKRSLSKPLKFNLPEIFPSPSEFLHPVDAYTSDYTKTSYPRPCGGDGARAQAQAGETLAGGRAGQNFAEQFCCRRPRQRQPQRCGLAGPKPSGEGRSPSRKSQCPQARRLLCRVAGAASRAERVSAGPAHPDRHDPRDAERRNRSGRSLRADPLAHPTAAQSELAARSLFPARSSFPESVAR
jgi:hypothetical protein